MSVFKKILTAIRANGRQHLQEGPGIRQLVFANMIWLATYGGFTVYTFIVIFFIPVPLLPFLVIATLCQLCFIGCFLLFRYNFLNTGKHCLVLSTYLFLMIFDHMTQKETLIYLHLLAFLPVAMNIFSVRKNSISVILYTLFPLIYTLFTKLAIYHYPSFSSLDQDSLRILIAFNIILSFTLFIMFGNYMVINNLARQHKLLLRSISLQTTLDNSIGAVWTIDKDYNLIATNTKYTDSIEKEFEVTGLKSGVNIRQHAIWEKLPHPLRTQYYAVLHGQDILHEIELNGKHFEIKGVPIYDPEGKIGGATFGSRDITDKKKAEENLLKAKKAAEEASVAKARFLSNMSHEIRTPLNGIIGITRIMLDEKFLPSQYENLKTLQDLSEHTLQIINNILDFAKIEAGKSSLENKRFNLQRFIRKINSIFSGTAKLKGLKFIIETEGQTDIYMEMK
jgi:signal transduction histidine kinase